MARTLRPLAVAMLLASITLGSSGCSLLPYEAVPHPRISNPRTDLDEVILVNFDGRPANEDPMRWQRSVQQQLLDIEGIDRIEVPLTADSPLLDPAPGRAFIGLTVLHFDPFYPPEAIVEVTFDVPAAPERTADAILQLDRIGREHTVSTGGSASGHRFQMRIDADDSRIGRDLVVFANSQLDGDRGSAPVDRVLRDSSRFVDFVSYLVLKETFTRLTETEKGTP